MNHFEWLSRALLLLGENIEAWEGEEDSVKEEHAELIEKINKFFRDYVAEVGKCGTR